VREQPAAPGEDVPDDPAADHDARAVLRVTAFRRLWLALGFSSFGDWLGLLATTALAGALSGSSDIAASTAVAGVFILRLAPAILIGPFAGACADRLSRRGTMVIGDLLRSALFVSIAVVGTLQWLYVATVLIECVALFWMPAKEATVPNLVPRRRLEAANRLSLMVTYGTAPLAAVAFSGLALISGILDNFLHALLTNTVDLALYVNAVTFLVSALTVARLDIPPRRSVAAAERVSVLRSILDGWRFVGATPVVRGIVLGMLGAFGAAGFVIGPAQSFAADLGAGPSGYGVLFGAIFTGLALGMWIGPRLLAGLSRRRLFGLALISAGTVLVAVALVPNIVISALLSVAIGACGGIAWVTGYTLLGLEVDDEVRGRTFGFVLSAARVVLVLVLAAGSALAGLIGRHELRFSDTVSLTYGGAAFVYLFAGMLAVVMGVVAYRQMDDRVGTSLVADLVSAWQLRRGGGPRVVLRTHPGLFVAFEGGDGSGKSTQARLLADWLRDAQGHEVVLTREPGATPLGIHLREVLLGHGPELDPRTEALLFAADRAHHVSTVIQPALETGSVVVTDRYVDSSVAYQGGGRAMDADDIAQLSRWATDGLIPDLTVLLDLPPDAARTRRRGDANRDGEDRMESEPEDFHHRVREHFLDLARREPHRYLVLDASDDIEDLHARVRERVREIMPVSARKRAELRARLLEEQQSRSRRADAEAEVLRLDAELRERQLVEAQERTLVRRRAREDAERELRVDHGDRDRRPDGGYLGDVER